MELENLGHGGRSVDVTHGLPGQGRTTELPSGGIPRTSGNKKGDAGTFYSPACPVHCGHFVGGEPPPPTFPPMRHSVTLVYTEQKSPCHRTVLQGIRAEEAAVSGRGIEVEHEEVL